MAGGATFLQGVMLEYERPELGRVAFATDLVLCHQLGAARNDGVTLMSFVAVRAAYLSFQHGMMIWEVERTALVLMALEAGFWRLARVDDRTTCAARFRVQAARTVTGFAADILRIVTRRFEAGVSSHLEITHGILMALFTSFRADVGRAGNARWRHQGAVDGAAGNDHPGCR